MAEFVALYIVCKNIGAVARSGGLKAQPFQARAIILWLAFEFMFAFMAAAMGLKGILLYVVTFGGALLSIHFSYKSVRAAVAKRAIPVMPIAEKSGTGIYCLALDNLNPGFDACFESSVFSEASRDIEAIASRLQIKSHLQLFSDAAQNSLDAPGSQEIQVSWFDPDYGIAWLAEVIGYIRANPLSVDRAEELMADLTRCQGILRKASEIGAKWHFERVI